MVTARTCAADCAGARRPFGATAAGRLPRRGATRPGRGAGRRPPDRTGRRLPAKPITRSIASDVDLVTAIDTVASGGMLSGDELMHLIEVRNAVSDALPAMPPTVRSRVRALVDVATSAYSIEWKRGHADRFGDLEGATITGWSGVEMALREEGPDGDPQFRDPAVPFLQVSPLDIEHTGGRVRVWTYQDDDGFGLYAEPARGDLRAKTGIFRTSHGLALPTGRVSRIEVTFESRVLAEVELQIGEQRVLLLAGEVQEDRHDTIRFLRLDESVLAFADARDADHIAWAPARVV